MRSAATSTASADRTAASARRAAFDAVWAQRPGFLGWISTGQNIPLARRYMVTAFAFFLLGGIQALVLRLQLMTADSELIDPATYNRLFTMHGTTMMFLFVIPFIEAIANYFLPLLLGTRDLPFPRLTALSYWTYLFGGIFLYASFFVGTVPDGGWFAYVPLTGPVYSPGLALDFWERARGEVGPSLDGFARRPFIAGALRNDPLNVERWIRDPQAVEPGTVMPRLNVTEAEARDIAAYLAGLR